MKRPPFESIQNGAEFNSWYWSKAEMVDICKSANLSAVGSKFQLRDRIMYALDNEGKALCFIKKKKPKSAFNWAKAELSLDTPITDNVSFGPNFRRFMKSQIGKKFSCHSDFMDWVKANVGKTLREAVLAWEALEARKADPHFKRKIADHNMFNQYVRDFLADNPGKQFQDAKRYWDMKKQMPMKEGFVRYESRDLDMI